jgi:hypothetical protein
MIRQHARHPGDVVELGPFEDFDLYVAGQSPLPPTLVARYGDAPADYMTFNPALTGRGSVRHYGAHFVEALRRADELRIDLKTTGENGHANP